MLLKRKSKGFTIVEIVIALFILAVFLIPLMQYFVRTRRVSIAAKDSIIVSSFQTSCMAELRQIEYDDLKLGQGATFSRVIKNYSDEKRFNGLDIKTAINFKGNDKIPMIEIDISSEFRFPGAPKTDPKRKVGMRGFVFPKP